MSEAIRGGGHESQRRRKKQRERDRGNGRSCQNWCMCAFTSHYRAVDRNSSIAPRRASPGPSSDSVPALCAWLCVSGPASGDSLSLSVSLSLAVSRARSLSLFVYLYIQTLAITNMWFRVCVVAVVRVRDLVCLMCLRACVVGWIC